MANGAAADIGFRNLPHFNGGLHAGGYAQFFQRILQSHGVDNCSQHAHVVGGCTVHAALAAFQASPDVAAAYDYSHFYARFAGFLDFPGQPVNHFRINAESLVVGQRLTGQFQHNSFVMFRFSFHGTPPEIT